MKDYAGIYADKERLAALGSSDDDRLYRQDVEDRSAEELAKTFRKRTLRATLDALDIPYTVEMSGLELAALICEGRAEAEPRYVGADRRPEEIWTPVGKIHPAETLLEIPEMTPEQTKAFQNTLNDFIRKTADGSNERTIGRQSDKIGQAVTPLFTKND